MLVGEWMASAGSTCYLLLAAPLLQIAVVPSAGGVLCPCLAAHCNPVKQTRWHERSRRRQDRCFHQEYRDVPATMLSEAYPELLWGGADAQQLQDRLAVCRQQQQRWSIWSAGATRRVVSSFTYSWRSARLLVSRHIDQHHQYRHHPELCHPTTCPQRT